MNHKRFALPPDIALPWHQQLAMRLYIGPFVASGSSVTRNRQTYLGFSQKIIDLVTELPFDKHPVPVLVPAQAGLLNDTRYWSVTQTLHHLSMVDSLTKEVIVRLGKGEPANIEIKPKMVAPSQDADPHEIFKNYCELVPTRMDEIDSLITEKDSTLTEEHPFFGKFTARQWHWSMAMRASLRYRQLNNILKGL